MKASSEKADIRAWILLEPHQPHPKVWGLPNAERLRRALRAAGIPGERISVGPASEVSVRGSALLLFRSDYVFDERLVQAVVTSGDSILISAQKAVAAHVGESRLAGALQLLRGKASPDSVDRDSGLRCVGPLDLVPAYTAALRKADPPYLLPVHPENIADVESHIFAASYKGITDLVTKWVWPVPARAVTRYLAHAGVRPNAVTLLSWILVILAALLFLQGRFGLGLVAAWLMTFLDTVDGKLARVTLTSSKVGHVLDHGLDLLHPPFWYLAWAVGLPAGALWLAPATVITVAGYVVGRLLEGIFLLAFKLEIHCWRPLDSFFRTITARRNPNLILLTTGTLAGRPDVGLVLVAGWTALSIGFHTVRLIQASIQHRRGSPVREWQEVRPQTAGAGLNPAPAHNSPESAA
jgi:phosphatidylglycerophosphate synthase